MITAANIYERMPEASKRSGIKQAEIARRLGIKPQQISCYVHGKKLPALDTLANLCKILDIDANYILCQDINDK